MVQSDESKWKRDSLLLQLKSNFYLNIIDAKSINFGVKVNAINVQSLGICFEQPLKPLIHSKTA